MNSRLFLLMLTSVCFSMIQPKDNTPWKLLFVNALWRHGDRAAYGPLFGGIDKAKEENWKSGGGGYAELTNVGMSEHFRLGRQLRARYIDSGFLAKRYRANEIYVRATDTNRTLNSAYANLAGMYSTTQDNVPGSDYPSDPSWPTGWVPIPVHTVFNPTDHEANPDAKCPRLYQLMNLVFGSPEATNYTKQQNVAETLEYLSNHTNREIHFNDIYKFNDTMHIEFDHFCDIRNTGDNSANISEWYPWFWNDHTPGNTADISKASFEYLDGYGNPNGVNGVDVALELRKIRGGETIKLIRTYAEGVITCFRNASNPDCKPFYSKLKYFAISAHDSTINAFLSILGPRLDLVKYGIPDYASAVISEFYSNSGSGDIFMKFFYHSGDKDDFTDVTKLIQGCPADQEYCPMSAFTALADHYDPGDIDKLCNTNIAQ